MVSYCGLTCQNCPIFLAAREKNEEERMKMRAEIARIIQEKYGTAYKPEDISDCDGCKTEKGRLFSDSKKCLIRKCARKKGIGNCAYCSEYPCGKLEEIFSSDPSAKERLDAIRNKVR